MQALIRDLLRLSRVESLAKPPVPTDANAVAADVVRTFGGDGGGRGTIAVGPLRRR